MHTAPCVFFVIFSVKNVDAKQFGSQKMKSTATLAKRAINYYKYASTTAYIHKGITRFRQVVSGGAGIFKLRSGYVSSGPELCDIGSLQHIRCPHAWAKSWLLAWFKSEQCSTIANIQQFQQLSAFGDHLWSERNVNSGQITIRGCLFGNPKAQTKWVTETYRRELVVGELAITILFVVGVVSNSLLYM